MTPDEKHAIREKVLTVGSWAILFAIVVVGYIGLSHLIDRPAYQETFRAEPPPAPPPPPSPRKRSSHLRKPDGATPSLGRDAGQLKDAAPPPIAEPAPAPAPSEEDEPIPAAAGED